MLRLHDTSLGKLIDFSPAKPGEVSIYVCGPTVYDNAHLGHGRAALVYDIFRRYLEWKGYFVHHVSNITDVDDKIIQRAAQENIAPSQLAQEYEDKWWKDMDQLNILRPTQTPHATKYIPDMIKAISDLMDKEIAYKTPLGIYFDTTKVDGYGLLAHQNLESLRVGQRIDLDTNKRNPIDFVLWKLSLDPNDQPNWDSPWGKGRPGWHTECVVMSRDLLGDSFDIHAGGLDLVFPHHENERIQAKGLGSSFARYWIHHAFVEINGEKMSKSLGNFTSLQDLLSKTDPRAFRILVLRSHYRSPLEVTPQTIEDASSALRRLDVFANRFTNNDMETKIKDLDSKLVESFTSKMDEDLNTPAALALIFDLVRKANAFFDSNSSKEAQFLAQHVFYFLNILGLETKPIDVEVDPFVKELIDKRNIARSNKDFVQADLIRDQLMELGWMVEDGPQGTQIRLLE